LVLQLKRNLKSKFLINAIGLVLVILSWFNPFGLGLQVRIILFIIGFDMMSILPKVGVFLLNLLFPFSTAFGYLSWTLLILFFSELSIAYTKVYKPYRLVIKPLAVFIVAFLALGLQPALVAAGIDLLINLTHKIRVGSKYKKR
jgi:hypothetical protein